MRDDDRAIIGSDPRCRERTTASRWPARPPNTTAATTSVSTVAASSQTFTYRRVRTVTKIWVTTSVTSNAPAPTPTTMTASADAPVRWPCSTAPAAAWKMSVAAGRIASFICWEARRNDALPTGCPSRLFVRAASTRRGVDRELLR